LSSQLTGLPNLALLVRLDYAALDDRSPAASSMQQEIATTQFTPVRSVRQSEENIRQKARLLEDGALRVNDRFPSERALQERWQVSRPVLREAFRVLEMQGVVESRPGDGRYLRSDHVPDPAHAWRHRLHRKREHLDQIWEAREAVESKAAELAARRATARDIAAIKKALRTLEAASLAVRRRFDLNRKFHLSVAKASGNAVIEEMVATLLLQSSRIGFKEALHDRQWPALAGRHRAIFEAIVARDPAAARKAMISHFQRMRGAVEALETE
jgi:GntR family transcriptional repressor for pyruvate dehydrogenase complex